MGWPQQATRYSQRSKGAVPVPFSFSTLFHALFNDLPLAYLIAMQAMAHIAFCHSDTIIERIDEMGRLLKASQGMIHDGEAEL